MRVRLLLMLFLVAFVLINWLIQPLLPTSPITKLRKEHITQFRQRAETFVSRLEWRSAEAAPAPPVTPVPPTATPNLNGVSIDSIYRYLPPANTRQPSKALLFQVQAGTRPPALPRVRPGEAIVLSGDVDGKMQGNCNLDVYWSGSPAPVAATGGYEVWLLTGETEDIARFILEIQQATERVAQKRCPRLP